MHFPPWAAELFKLSGILIVVIGFALRLKPTVVVVAAALVTGLLARSPLLSDHPAVRAVPGLSSLARPGAEGLLDMLGRAFADNRLMTLFILTLPAIALSERFGLQRRAAGVIRGFRAATEGRLLIAYQLFRVAMGILGLRVNGHATFVRPLVYPMAVGAASANGDAKPQAAEMERIKAASAASENYGNFYGQNLSAVQPGILLVYGVLRGLGYTVSVWRLVLFAIPIATLTVVIGAVQFWLFSRSIRRRVACAGSAA
jgi:uncharacterized membrane protein